MKIDVHDPTAKARFAEWISNRGGVVVWRNLEIGSQRGNVFTPATTQDGKPGVECAPHWAYGSPTVHTSLDDFRFAVAHREVKRLRVANRRGDGLTYVLTDASAKRLRKVLDTAGPDATYHFDYWTKEAIVEVPVWE